MKEDNQIERITGTEKHLLEGIIELKKEVDKEKLKGFLFGLAIGMFLTLLICLWYFNFGHYTEKCVLFCLDITNGSCDIPAEYLNRGDFEPSYEDIEAYFERYENESID